MDGTRNAPTSQAQLSWEIGRLPHPGRAGDPKVDIFLIVMKEARLTIATVDRHHVVVNRALVGTTGVDKRLGRDLDRLPCALEGQGAPPMPPMASATLRTMCKTLTRSRRAPRPTCPGTRWQRCVLCVKRERDQERPKNTKQKKQKVIKIVNTTDYSLLSVSIGTLKRGV